MNDIWLSRVFVAIVLAGVAQSGVPGLRSAPAVEPEAEPQWTHPLEAEEILALDSTLEDDEIENEGKTIDEIIFDADTQAGSAAEAHSEGGVVVEGDMVMTPRQYLASYAARSSFTAMIKDEKHLWPKAVVPWSMTNNFAQDQKGVDRLYSAMKEWMEKTCVVFTPKGSETHKAAGGGSGITIFSGQGCFSSVGKSGLFRVSLGRGCKDHGVSLHELGHVLGLHHEQARIDRDEALLVLRKNAYSQKGVQLNFDIQQDTDPRGLAYDYCSIMHYGPYAFSATGQFTIVTKDQDYQFTIGNPKGRKSLTFEDAKSINMLYKCNAKCPSQPRCKAPCYVDHKCACACPEPNHCAKRPCKDYNTSTEMLKTCDFAKKYNRCAGRTDMARLCAESCGYCDYARKELANVK